MIRFFLITFQWPTGTGFRTNTMWGNTDQVSDGDAFRDILEDARTRGIPNDATVITFHLEPAR